MDLLRIYDDEDLRALPSGVWGIKEPTYQYRDAPRMKGPYLPPIHLPVNYLRTYSLTTRTTAVAGRGGAGQQRRTTTAFPSTSF